MIDADLTRRVTETIVETIARARHILALHGHHADLRDQVDGEELRGVIEVVVGDVAVYRIAIDVSDVHLGAVVGRWQVDALRGLGLDVVADKVVAIAARRHS